MYSIHVCDHYDLMYSNDVIINKNLMIGKITIIMIIIVYNSY